MILAGIDIGTNAVRLLIADVAASSFRELASGRIITRLGQDLDRSGLLSPNAQERTLTALQEFSRTIASRPVAAVSAVGTSALRNAGNAVRFLSAVKERAGLEVRVIDGEEEARLTLLGVRRALASAKGGADPLASALVIDIGGGSTELIASRSGRVEDMQSLHLGAVYLTERHVRNDPPTVAELEAVRSIVRRELDAWAQGLARSGRFGPEDVSTLAGTAGTVTTLAAMDLRLERYDPGKVSGHILSRSSLDRMIRELSSLTLEKRRTLPGLEPGREDIILAGAVICQEIMDRCGRPELLVSDWGLREGIVLDLFERLSRRPS